MKIVLYTNILTPYRKYTYDLIYQSCREMGDDFHVLVMANTEGNRTWTYDNLKAPYTELLGGFTLGKGETYIHFNKKLINKLRELKPDIVVCAGSYLCPGVWLVAGYKKRLHYKCLFWSESHLNEQKGTAGLKATVRESIRQLVYKRYDGFWYAGKLSREFIEKYAKNDAEYFFFPNLIEEDKYKSAGEMTATERLNNRRELGIDDEKTIFFCPARLSPVKGILEFMDLFDMADNKEKAVVLIAGTGDLKDEIERKAVEKNLNVRLLGYKNQDEVIGLYGMADVFLMPSLSDPNPLTCIEALWAGLPLFISNHCGNYPEVVSEGRNGYVFSYAKPDEATKKLELVIESSTEWRTRAGEVSRMRAEKCYCSGKTVKELLNLLHEKLIKRG